MMKRISWLVCSLALWLASSACQPVFTGNPIPATAAPTSTSSPLTTPTLTRTLTILPTAAPPTLTPIPPTLEPTPLPDFSSLVHLFDYDPTAPLAVEVVSAREEDGSTVQVVQYQGAKDCKVSALLVLPTGKGPYPAAIYMHMGGKNKTQYLEEAKLLTQQGAASLLPDYPFLLGCGNTNEPREGYINTVVNVRRGIDFLETLPEIDKGKIAYVGHSYGATWGGVLAGVEPRIQAYVLIAGYAQVSRNDTPDVPDLDAINYIGHASSAAFLFQFSTEDAYVSKGEAQQYFNAAPEPKQILWYDTTHAGLQEGGQADRLGWLAAQLGLTVP